MKKVLMGVMVISLGLAGISSAKPLVDNLVGYWALDGNGNDASIFGNDGTFVNSPEVVLGDPNVVLGQALHLDGTNYVSIDNAPVFDIPGPITLSAWIKVDVFDTDWQTFFCRGDWSWRMARSGGDSADPEEVAFHMSGPSDYGPYGVKDVVDGQWHHILGHWPGDGTPATLYVDGAVDAATGNLTGSIQSAAQAGADDPVTIGCQINYGTVQRQWKGYVDEVAIWNRALTAGEIAALYNSGNAVSIVDWRATPPISPADGAEGVVVDPSVTLEWTAGTGASPAITSHNVYIGTDQAAVANATTSDTGIYQGNTTNTQWTVNGLTQDKIYYWRIDECNTANITEPNETAKGVIWSFDADYRVTFVQQPANVFPIAGDTVQFSVVVTSDTPVTAYQWFGPSGMLTDGGDVSGATTDTLTVANVEAADEGGYYCAVTNSYGAKESNPGQLTLLELLGHWPLDGNGNDISGNGNDGVKQGDGTEAYATGIIGQAANFTNDWMLGIPNPSFFDVANNSLTVYCWINSSGTDNWEPFVSRRGEGSEGWQLRKRGGDDIVTFTLRNTSGDDDPTPSRRGLFNSQWHQVVGTYDGAQRVIYMDGVAIMSFPDTGTIGSADEAVAIGGRFNGTAAESFFTGLIDDVRIYNGALNANTVAALYTAATGLPVCTNPPDSDISGPAGVPDCIVDTYDLAAQLSAWLECNWIPDTFCP